MMARRVAGVVSIGIAITLALWLITGPTASGFVKSALFAIVGSILVLYKFDDIVAKTASRNQPEIAEVSAPTGGVFDTDLPAEAFAEPAIESKSVNLSRGKAGGGEHTDVLVFPETEATANEHKNGFTQEEPVARLIFSNAEEIDDDEPPSDAAELPAESTAIEAVESNGTSQAVVTSEPTFIQLSDYTNDDLVASVKAGEASLVSALTESGMLSTEGALTDTDVATMVFVAVSSDDLLRVLLAGKQAESEAEALSYAPDTPELYQPAPELVESRSQG